MKNLHDYLETGRATQNAARALDVIIENKEIDGAHHKEWLLDQVVRELTGKHYDQFVQDYETPYSDEHSTYTPEWDTGIAP